MACQLRLALPQYQTRKYTSFESDGSLMMNLQELQTLKTLNRPVTIFLQNNDGYASIRATQENYFEGDLLVLGHPHALKYLNLKRWLTRLGLTILPFQTSAMLIVRLNRL